MSLVEQWNRLEIALDPSWADARLNLRIDDPKARGRAAALLGPAGPGIAGDEIRFLAARDGAGVGPEAVRRLLRRIDDEGISGTIELMSATKARSRSSSSHRSLAAAWDAAVAALPEDWSDALVELELDSSNDIDRAAVLAGPVNPIQAEGRPGFRFRAASRAGFGASAGMVRRCLERLDAEGIGGDLKISRSLSDTHPVGTQGAVFSAGSRPR
jgi:hypothetical protein